MFWMHMFLFSGLVVFFSLLHNHHSMKFYQVLQWIHHIFTLVNLCGDLNIIFYKFFIIFLSTNIIVIGSLFHFTLICYEGFLIISKFKFSFYDTLFCPFFFLDFHNHHVLNSLMFALSVANSVDLCLHLILLSLMQLLLFFFL